MGYFNQVISSFCNLSYKMSASASAANTQKVIRISNYADYDIASVNGELVFTLRENVPATSPAPQSDAEAVPETYVASPYDMTCGKDERPCVPEGTKKYVCKLNNNKSFVLCNNIPFIPNILPDSIEEIDCTSVGLVGLPNPLPANLKFLRCANNNLTALPAKLPAGLKYLNCCNNKLSLLPDLPNTLTELYMCTGNDLYKNYPKLIAPAWLKIKEVIDYINQRNREMRGEIPTRVTETELFEYSLANSIITLCRIRSKTNELICGREYNLISYRSIVVDVLSKLSLSDIIASKFNVKLKNQNGESGYQWCQEVGLSIQNSSATETLRKLIDLVKTHHWKMIITIKLANNTELQFKYPEST